MYPVSTEFMEKMKSDRRRVLARVEVDYTDPFMDQSIEVQASEQANVSYPAQTADAVLEPFAKIPSLDGSWVLDGSFALAPGPEEANTHQMGWWGSQLSQVDGTFVQPYPTLTVTHFARPIHSLQVVGDNIRDEHPVDFRIDLYDSDDTLLYTENVSGNTEMIWRKTLPSPILDVAKQVLTITKWNRPSRQAKILEFFTSIQETYEGDDIISIHLLEEREVSQGSLPVGTISANEIEIRLNNETRKFDAGNKQSPLYQTLRVNRRIKAWLGVDTAEGKEYVPLGTFWSGDWRVPEDGVYAQTIGRDRLELLRNSTYSTSEVLPKPVELTPPTFTRDSVAYLPDGTQVAANVPRFEQGKFGKAVMVEEGTTNIHHEDLYDSFQGGQHFNVTDVEREGFIRCKRFERIAEGNAYFIVDIPCLPNTAYTLTFWIRGVNLSPDSYVNMYLSDDTQRSEYLKCDNLTDEFKKFTITRVTSADATKIVRASLHFGTNNIKVGEIIEVADWQLEAKPYSTSFIDGTRSRESLTISTTGVLSPQEGTVEFWFIPQSPHDYNQGPQHRRIFFAGTLTNANYIQISQFSTSEFVRFLVGDGAGNSKTISFTFSELGGMDFYDKPHFIAAAWSKSENMIYLRVDDQTKISTYPSQVPSLTDTIYIGNRENTEQANGLIDDLRISSIARTDEEILAAYNSNKPAVWDEDTTYLLRFDGNLDSAQQTTTLYNLARNILTDAGLTEEEYFIDPELKQFPVPYAYFEPQSHREALRKIAEACLGQVYCDRNGIIRIEGPSFLQSQTEPVATITQDDYFRKDNPVKWSEIANYVEVETQPLKPDVSQEVYRSNEPVPITAGQTKTITAYYNHTPCIEATATLENAVSGAQITKATYYAWGADITVTSTNTGTFELVINAKPLKVLNKEKIIAKDDASIADNGMLKYTFPANPLVQTREAAQKIADALLAYFKNPKRVVEIEWRGNPALLLGDRIAVVDKDETNEYYVTRQELEFDGALRARLNGRRV